MLNSMSILFCKSFLAALLFALEYYFFQLSFLFGTFLYDLTLCFIDNNGSALAVNTNQEEIFAHSTQFSATFIAIQK